MLSPSDSRKYGRIIHTFPIAILTPRDKEKVLSHLVDNKPLSRRLAKALEQAEILEKQGRVL